jgi:hypothetical protein
VELSWRGADPFAGERSPYSGPARVAITLLAHQCLREGGHKWRFLRGHTDTVVWHHCEAVGRTTTSSDIDARQQEHTNALNRSTMDEATVRTEAHTVQCGLLVSIPAAKYHT